MTTTPPPASRGATTGRATTASLPRPADRHTHTRRVGRVDLVLSDEDTRSRRLHRNITRLRRVSKALDWLILAYRGQCVEPVGDYYHDAGLDRPAYRDHREQVRR
jgi:hypothetical protein